MGQQGGSGRCPEIVETGASARAAWERISSASDELPVSHVPQWLDCVCSSGRYVDATRAYRTTDGRTLVLPLVRRRLSPAAAGDYQSWPYLWDAGADNGGLISDGTVTAEDVSMVAGDLASLSAARIQVTPGAWDNGRWEAAALPRRRRMRQSAHVVSLGSGSEATPVDGMSARSRKRLRKAERTFEIESDTTGRLLPVVDTLFQQAIEMWAREHWLPTATARRLLTHREPPDRRAELARRFGGRYRLWVAWRADQPVAAITVLSAGPAATFGGGATDKEAAGNFGVGQLLHFHAMATAQREGRVRYDLGASGAPSQVYFKESLGAQPVIHSSYSFERLPITAIDETARATARTILTQASRLKRSSVPDPPE